MLDEMISLKYLAQGLAWKWLPSLSRNAVEAVAKPAGSDLDSATH